MFYCSIPCNRGEMKDEYFVSFLNFFLILIIFFRLALLWIFSGFFWTFFIYFVWLTENVDFECFIRFDRLTSGVKMKNWPIQELAQFGLSESFHNWFIRISARFQKNYQASYKSLNLNIYTNIIWWSLL